MQQIPLELVKTNRDGVGEAREAYVRALNLIEDLEMKHDIFSFSIIYIYYIVSCCMFFKFSIVSLFFC